MTADEVRLKSPLPCWHESLASARTDPLVSLSLEGGHIQTDRPVPPGTAMFLELSLGQSLGAEKTEIDAVAESAHGDGAGFYVRFLRLDERARAWIEERVRQARGELAPVAAAALPAPPPAPAAPPAAGAAHPLDEPTREPTFAPAPIAAVPALPALDDEPTREPALATAPEAKGGFSDDTAPLPPAPAVTDEAFALPPLTPAPIEELQRSLDAPAPPPEPPAPAAPAPSAAVAAAPAEQTASWSRPALPSFSTPAPAVPSLADVESTQRWAIPPKSAPAAIAAPPPAPPPDVAEAPALAPSSLPSFPPPRALAAELSLDETQPWARASGNSIPPQPLPAPDQDADAIESTRPWARAQIAPARAERPAAIAAVPADAPAWSPPASAPPAPAIADAAPTPAPPALPRTPTPSVDPLAVPMPRMAQLDVPGAIPPAQSFNETMRWPAAQLRVAQAPLEMPVAATPDAPPPELDEPGADQPPVADAGLDALFGVDADPASSADAAQPEAPADEPVALPPIADAAIAAGGGFDAPALLSDAPRPQTTPPTASPFAAQTAAPRASNPFEAPRAPPPAPVAPQGAIEAPTSLFGEAGGFLGGDDDLPTGGNGALDFGVEVTDPGGRPHDDDELPPVIATLEDEQDLAAAPPETDVAATEEGALPSDLVAEGRFDPAALAPFGASSAPALDPTAADPEPPAVTDEEPAPADSAQGDPADADDAPMELLDAELEEYKDVLGDAFPAPVAAPSPEPIADAPAPQQPLAQPLPPLRPLPPLASLPPLGAPPRAPTPASVAPSSFAAAATDPFGSGPPLAAARPNTTLPYLPAADVAAALAAATPSAPATRTTDPLFPAFTDPVPAAQPVSAPPPSAPPPRSATPLPNTAPQFAPQLPPPLPARPAPSAAPPPIPARTAPPTLMFSSGDVNAAVAAARGPATAHGAMLTNATDASAPAAGELPAALAAQLPGDAEFELAFQMADPPARSAAHEPSAWAVSAVQAAIEEDELPLVVGNADLPVVVGSAPRTGEHEAPTLAPESWVVSKKP